MPKKGFSSLTLKESAMKDLVELAKKLDVSPQKALNIAVEAYIEKLSGEQP